MRTSSPAIRWIMRVAYSILLFSAGSPAASSGIGPADMTWRKIGEEKGYFGGSVSCLLQDRKGIIWIGAAGGLFRYDGSVFKVYRPREGGGGLASSSVSSLVEDGRGALWIGTDGGGLFRHRPAESRFERVELGKDQGSAAAFSRISALAIDASGRILVGTASGKLLFGDADTSGFAALEGPGGSDQPITAILVDSKGKIWVGCDGAGLARYDSEGRLEARFRHDPASSDSLGSDSVWELLEDSLGFLWVGLGQGGVDLVAGAGFRHAREDRATSSALPRLRSLAEDPRGQIWMGFAGGGMGLLDPSSMEIRRVSFADGIEVRVLHRDRRGLIWAGLERGGLLTGDLRSAGFERFTETLSGAKFGEIEAMALSADGRVYACTSEGILAALDVDGAGFRRVETRLAELDPSAARTMLGAGDGSLWIGGSMPGLGRLDRDGRWRWYPLPAVPGKDVSAVLSLREDSSGRILVGTEGGAAIFDPVDGSLRRLGLQDQEGRTPGWAISDMLEDREGKIWAGSADSGLSVLDPATGAWSSPPNSREAIGDLRIEALFQDSRGALVIGTGGAGLAAMDPGSGRILYRGTEAGIAADSIRSIVEDRAGILWISSSRGLYSLDPERRSSFLLGPEDGLCPGSIGAGALILDGEGRVLAASGTGVARFDPLRAPRYAPAPEVVISEIAAAGEELRLQATGEGSGLVLGFDNPGLRFGIAVVDYLAPERNRFAMMLEGRNRAWIPMDSVNAGYIAPLSPGKYMLRVKASNGNGIWNDYGASLGIAVTPPWWGTWWFRTVAVGAFAALAGAAVVARTGSLRKRNALLVQFARHIDEAREEERKTAARDIHDEIGQHLMALNFHAYWLASHPEAGPETRGAKISEIQTAVRDAMESVKTVAGRLRPAALEVQDLPDALRLQIFAFKRMSGIDARLDLAEGWREPPKPIASAALRIFQEMLGNAARHSGARRVVVNLSLEGDILALRVVDDGRGIEAAKIDAPDSFGIIGMRERCVAFGGTLDFENAEGGGCAVVARLPLDAGRGGRKGA